MTARRRDHHDELAPPPPKLPPPPDQLLLELDELDELDPNDELAPVEDGSNHAGTSDRDPYRTALDPMLVERSGSPRPAPMTLETSCRRWPSPDPDPSAAGPAEGDGVLRVLRSAFGSRDEPGHRAAFVGDLDVPAPRVVQQEVDRVPDEASDRDDRHAEREVEADRP